MKKRIILLPFLALMLSACDGLNLNDLLGSNGGNNNAETTSRERSSVSPNDLAIKIADYVSVFPEIGDSVDLSEYIDFETGTDYKLSDFTFTSSDPTVISVDSQYRANCLKRGYTAITVSGPGLNTPVPISFFVGSIAGNYVPDSRALNGVISLNIAEGTDGYTFALNVVNNGKQYNKRDIVDYSGGGSLIKNISPFLPMDFNGSAPSTFEPIANYLLDLIGDGAEQFKDLTDDVYAYMAADPDQGVLIKMRFNNTFITLVAEQVLLNNR